MFRLARLGAVPLRIAAISTIWGGLCLAAEVNGQSQESQPPERQIANLIRQVDSGRFAARRQAARKLEELAARPEFSRTVAEQLQRALVTVDMSFEARQQLEAIRATLPAIDLPRPEDVPPAELDRLLRQLDDNSYGARLGAQRRIEWLLENPKLICPIMARLREPATRQGLSIDTRRSFNAIYERARGAWLTADPAACQFSAVSEGQVVQWIDELVRHPEAAGEGDRPGGVLEQLRDALARDDDVAKIKAALEARLAGAQRDVQAAARLREVIDLCRPAMVAEYWSGRHHRGIQFLYLGVPDLQSGARNPSHFDRIDDHTAHCVTGQSLSPGDYPVGVAIVHPNPGGQNAFFHLVNLSTPRRQMAYAYQSKTDEAQRLRQLSRRTGDWLIAQKMPLSAAQINMLEVLDPDELSRFAGPLFRQIDDVWLPEDEVQREEAKRHMAWPVDPSSAEQFDRGLGWGRPSHHGMICRILATEGTHQAIPGLLKAIEAKRFREPSDESPYQLPWIAALAIAARDPWPRVDAWLAGLIARTDPLMKGSATVPELGATAAGLLLNRHRQDAANFGLSPLPNADFARLGLTGYQFTSPESRRSVQGWWEKRSAASL